MYFSVFSSSEYYSYEDITNNISIDKNELCLICWLPQEEQNEIKLLSEFSHIKPNCKCKPKLHSTCIKDWIKKSETCPICRAKMNIIIFTTNYDNILINCYIVCISYTTKLLKIISYLSLIKLLCLLVYNIYVIYIMTNKLYEDDHGIC